MTADQSKQEIAKRLCFRAKDVMLLTGYGSSTAYVIMDECRRKYGGLIPLRPEAIKAESLFAYFGTTRSDYLKSINEEEE